MRRLWNRRRTINVEDSDSDNTSDPDDPLEEVLQRLMSSQHESEASKTNSVVTYFATLFFIFGFLICYIVILFIVKDVSNKWMDNAHVARYLRAKFNLSNIEKYGRILQGNNYKNHTENSTQASYIQKYFEQLSYDSVSPVQYHKKLLIYFDKNEDNMVSLLKYDKVIQFHGSELAKSCDNIGCIKIYNRVEGDMIYINYGEQHDYNYRNMSIQGKIVLARLGKFSAVHLFKKSMIQGAKGVILFSDQQVDNKTGDLLISPGHLAKIQKYFDCLSADHMGLAAPIQVLNIEDAARLLREIFANITEIQLTRINPNHPNEELRDILMKVVMDVNLFKINYSAYHILAALRGMEEPDRYIIFQCETCGTGHLLTFAGCMEFARLFKKMKDEGWSPHRTLIFLFEEYGCGDKNVYSINTSVAGNILEDRIAAKISLDIEENMNDMGIKPNRIELSPVLTNHLRNSASLLYLFQLYNLSFAESYISTAEDDVLPIINRDNDHPVIYLNIKSESIAHIHFQLSKTKNGKNFRPVQITGEKFLELLGYVVWQLVNNALLPFDIVKYAQYLNNSLSNLIQFYALEIDLKSTFILKLKQSQNRLFAIAEKFQRKLGTHHHSNIITTRILNDQMMMMLKNCFFQDKDKAKMLWNFGLTTQAEELEMKQYDSGNYFIKCVNEGVMHNITSQKVFELINVCINIKAAFISDPVSSLSSIF